MNVFDPVATADIILSQYKIGDIIEPDALSEILEARLPFDTETYAIAKELTFQRLSRVQLVCNELLRRNILGDLKNYALVLVAQEHRVDHSMTEARKKIVKSLRDAYREVSNFETNDPVLLGERNDTLAYLDTLRAAINPRSRRTKPFAVAVKA